MKITAPAKINLNLRIGRLRQDGYHDLKTVMQTLRFGDELTFIRTKEKKIAFANCGFQSPVGKRNIVVRAAHLLQKEAEVQWGVRICLRKKIPTQAGLGGGSSDAAATLRALNDLWECKFSLKKLLTLAIQLGSDVPFFLRGGQAQVAGRGEQIRPLKSWSRKSVILAKPSFGVDTKNAYATWDKLKKRQTRLANISHSAPRKTQTNQPQNDFEQVVFPSHPSLAEWKKFFLEEGAIHAGLTGSGSTVFGVFDCPKTSGRVAEKIKRRAYWLVETET